MKKNKRTGKRKKKKNHNPADEGLDHNLRYGDERDLKASYLMKQESAANRGVDNEDDTSYKSS